MTRLIEFRTAQGEVILVEAATNEPQSGEVEVSSTGVLIEKTSRTFEQTIGMIGPLTEILIEKITAVAQKPDEMALELGVKLSAEGGLVIASASMEGQVTIKLLWKRK